MCCCPSASSERLVQCRWLGLGLIGSAQRRSTAQYRTRSRTSVDGLLFDEIRLERTIIGLEDYVLFMLFIKYVSDKYGASTDFAPPVTIPIGSSFKDMVRLKSKADIGNRINTDVIPPLIDANTRLARTDFPSFLPTK